VAKDLDKYKADVLKLAGVALTIPAGKMYLDLPLIFSNNINFWLGLYYFVSVLLWLLGIIVVLRGVVHLQKD